MSIEFGLSRLRAIVDGISTGIAITGPSTGTAAVASGQVWIDGVYCQVSATSILIDSSADTNTGTMYFYAHLPATESSTAQVTFATGSSPEVLNFPNIGRNKAVISKAVFGSSTAAPSDFQTSGLTGMKIFGRAQNCSLTMSYDQAQSRGGTYIFPTDAKLYNGSIEGTLEGAVLSAANIAGMYGADYALDAGGGSGTMTLTATHQPVPFMVESQQITNGVTSTIQILRCYSNQITMNMDRENYLIPSLSFQAYGNLSGTVMKWNI